jgi:hypothetical protein
MGGMASWLVTHGFDLISTLGVIAGLTFTALSFRRDDRSRRVANLLRLTGSHRDLWSELLREPKLRRILDPRADLASGPMTLEEELFVTLVIQHLNGVFHALQDDLTVRPEGLGLDVRQFLALPIPRSVWQRLQPLQNEAFVAFVERCLRP